ncbi:MAG TPA: UDP-N-acetylmuramate--L-alanine ligase [Anaerolineales bacterium]
MKRAHLIGIGGSGLSAIARLLLESGWSVSGSDRQISPLAEQLQAAGARITLGHRPENVAGAELVIRSSAIPDDNVEVRAAREANIPVLKRADFLGELMAGKLGIAIAGTHGKTTTTAMIAWVLTALGHDPSFLIGGVSMNLETNARAGQGDAFVIEADEYDRMFLGLRPEIAVVTNIEHDHPDCFPTPQDFQQAFQDFANRLSPDGVLLACTDDRGAARLLADSAGQGYRTLAYGLERWLGRPGPDYAGRELRLNERGGFDFDAFFYDTKLASTALQVPGKHNVRNALAALAVAHILGLPPGEAAEALGDFKGTGRRFELRGEVNGVTVVDDYAHHPTEIRATLAAARTRYSSRKLWAVWQPHTYSRTRTLFDEFTGAFADADHVLVTEVFASREANQGNFSARQVVAAMRHPDVHFVPSLIQAGDFLLERLQPGDVVLVLSAGDADQVSARVLAGLAAPDRQEFIRKAG